MRKIRTYISAHQQSYHLHKIIRMRAFFLVRDSGALLYGFFYIRIYTYIQYGNSALLAASIGGHFEVAAALCYRGADIEAQNIVSAAVDCG